MTVKLIDSGLGRRIPVNNNSTEVSFTSLEKVKTGSEDELLGLQGLIDHICMDFQFRCV